jgi:hypothetical protein
MPKLSDQIENSLNESRILMLGGQVLLGFAYRPFFESSFTHLTRRAQLVQTISVAILTMGLVWLMYPAAFHQIAERGKNTARLHRVTTEVLDWALLPFATAMGLNGFVIASFLRVRYAAYIGLVVCLFALAWWYGFAFMNSDPRKGAHMASEMAQEERKQEREQRSDIKDRVKKLLIECRMILPGVQALLGFQLTTFFMQGFEQLSESSKMIHAAGLIATGIATVLIITPAAYHRIAEAGEDTEHFYTVASRLMLGSMFFLGIGLYADFLIILHKMGLALHWASVVATSFLLCSFVLWFALPALSGPSQEIRA